MNLKPSGYVKEIRHKTRHTVWFYFLVKIIFNKINKSYYLIKFNKIGYPQ